MIFDSSIRRIAKPDQPQWLTSLQNEMALSTNQDAQKHWGNPARRGAPYYNSRLEHIQQVERDALRISVDVDADLDILLAAVWAHDYFPPHHEGDRHASQTADWARGNLVKLGFPYEKIEAVAYAIEHHTDGPGTIPEQAVEARLIWDANKLARMGPLNIVAYLCSHPAFPDSKITYTNLTLLGLEKLEQSRRVAENLYFESARRLAHERYTVQKAFYESLAEDVRI